MTAGAVQPGDSDPVSDLEVCDSRAERDHDAGAFVPGNEGQSWLERPVSLGRVQVGVAHSTGDHLYKSFSRAWDGYLNFLNDEGLAEFLHHCCFHSCWVCHDCCPPN